MDLTEGRYTNAPPFFHFTGTKSLTYRIDYPDGRYIVGSSITKLQIEANAESGSGNEKDTEVSQDDAVVYLAGQQIGTVTVHETFHTTFNDADHDGAIDPGELKSSVDTFRVSCPQPPWNTLSRRSSERSYSSSGEVWLTHDRVDQQRRKPDSDRMRSAL